MDDGLVALLQLVGAISAGPSNAGHREDGKICTAQPGECRHNRQYYSPGMKDAKSWSDPCADEICPDCCAYLSESPCYMGSEEERRGRALDLVEGLQHKAETDRAARALGLAMMGIDPRKALEEGQDEW